MWAFSLHQTPYFLHLPSCLAFGAVVPAQPVGYRRSSEEKATVWINPLQQILALNRKLHNHKFLVPAVVPMPTVSESWLTLFRCPWAGVGPETKKCTDNEHKPEPYLWERVPGKSVSPI